MVVKNLVSALRDEESVYINDLGMFQKCFKSAQLEKNTLCPPQYYVSFDGEAEGSGFAFTLYISKHELIKIVDADRAVREWVQQLLTDLKKNKKAFIAGLGRFSIKKDGQIDFESDLIPALNEEYEGMNPISVKKVDRKGVTPVPMVSIVSEQPTEEPVAVPEEPAVAEQPTEEPVAAPEEPAVAEQPTEEPVAAPEEPAVAEQPAEEPVAAPEEPAVAEQPKKEPVAAPEEPVVAEQPEEETKVQQQPVESSEETDDEIERKKSWIWVIIIFILLIIGGLGYVFRGQLLDWYHQYLDKNAKVETVAVDTPAVAEEPVIVEDTLSVEDTIIAENEMTIEKELNLQPFDINYLQHIDFQLGKYYVVHGSFLNESDCIRHIKSHQFAKYEPTLLHQSDKTQRLRICLKVFRTEAEAEAFAATINGAWVLSE